MSQVRCLLVGLVAACASSIGVVLPAAASADDPPPDLSLSTLSCAPENAVPPAFGSTRPGDVVLCRMQASVTGPTIGYHVTADITIPPGTAWAPLPNAQGTPVPADDPTRIFFDETKLGLITPGMVKPASVRLRIRDDTPPGTPIQPVATLRDPLAATKVTTANLLTTMPQRADLSPSTALCENADPARSAVYAGDTLDCRFLLTGKPGREDAVGVSLSAAVPAGTAWVSGGNETFRFNNNLNWYGSVLDGGVPSGASAPNPLRLRVRVDPNLPGGAKIYVNGTAGWVNALSGDADSLGIGATPIVVRPGPAVLTGSTLGCVDVDANVLLAGDLVDCVVTVRPAAGHEDVEGVAARAAVPAPAGAVSATDATGSIPLALGAIANGASQAGRYRLKVSPAAVAGDVLVPTAVVTGTSVPEGGPFTLALQGDAMVVGTRPAPTVNGVAAKAAVAAPVAAAGRPASRAPVICGSRRVVTVNVKPPKGQRWRSVTVAFATKTVKGKQAPGARGKKGYFRARLVFQGLPKGPLKVAVKGVTATGRMVRSSRAYNLCVKKK